MTIYNTGITPSSITFFGNQAYVCNNNNYGIAGSDNVTVFDWISKVTITTINDSSFNQPYRAAIDGRNIYVTNSGGSTVTVIDGTNNTVSEVISGFDGPTGILITKKTMYVTNYGSNGGVGSGNGTTITVYDLSSKTITATITTSLAPVDLALSPDKKFLYCLNYVDGNPNTGTINVINRENNTIVNTITGFSGPFGMTVSKKNKVYVTNFGSNNFSPYGNTVSVVNMKTNTITNTISVGIQPAGVCLSEDERKLYVSNYNSLYSGPSFTGLTYGNGTINVISTKKNKVKSTLSTLGQAPSFLTIKDNKLYVTSYVGNIVQSIKL